MPIAPPIALGRLSPKRTVPAHIVRPEYAEDGRPADRRGRSCVKTGDALVRMRRACTVAREILDIALDAVAVGVTTDEIDRIVHAATIERGAYPSTLNYVGFPKSLCTSANEVICHGIPDDRRLVDGDIVNCDVTIYIDGMHGDCSETVFVGTPDPQSRMLVEQTYASMMLGIAAVKPGVRLNEVGKAIARHAKTHKLGVVRDFAGHGIGELFHLAPTVAHYYDRHSRLRLKPGMTFTIEPMLTLGAFESLTLTDNWTAITRDRSRSAQFEHTILVTETGAEILTNSARAPVFRSQG